MMTLLDREFVLYKYRTKKRTTLRFPLHNKSRCGVLACMLNKYVLYPTEYCSCIKKPGNKLSKIFFI